MKKKWIIFPVLIALCISLVLPVHGENSTELEQMIIDSCTYNETIYLSSYGITVQQLHDLFFNLHDSGRLPWYVFGSYSYNYLEDTGLVTDFTPKYMDETKYDRALYEQMVAQILRNTVFEGMSQWQIALSIHDYLISNSEYDETLVLEEGYDLLVNGIAVCNGYAEAYMDLMNRCGIPTVLVSSDPMNHCWNLVCIDDKWYHVDVTWDDPVSNVHGRVEHTYFLLTDEEIRSGDDPHYDWVTDIACTDTGFSDAFWKDVDSQICYADSNTSYLLREDDYTNYIYSRNENSGKETLLYTDKKTGLDIGQGRYYYPHLGLSLRKGKLYFSDTATCYSMNPDGSEVTPVFRYDAIGNSKHIHGVSVCGTNLCLTLRSHDGNFTHMSVPLEAGEDHDHSFTSQVIEPTCMAAGMTVHTCPCGFSYTSHPTRPAAHSYEETVIQKLTLTSDGESVFTCSVCKDTFTQYYSHFDPIEWLMEEDYRMYAAIAIGFWLVTRIFRGLFKKKK